MKKYGLFIGIDQYDDPEISPLTCAARDAQDLAEVFRYKLGFETEVLTHLDLKQGQRVMQRLRSFEAKLVSGDVFVLYFAGHGKTAGEADQLLLLPEVSVSVLAAGHVAGADVLSCLALRAHTDDWMGVSRVFIFDACRLPLVAAVASRGDGGAWDDALQFAGAAVYRALALGGAPQGGGPAVAAPFAPLAILNSCVDRGWAEELPKLGHGLFTASLLAQLQECDKSAPLVVNQTLADALGSRMQTLARQYGRRSTMQRPLLHGAEVVLFAPDPLHWQQWAGVAAQVQAAPKARGSEEDAAHIQAGLRADIERQLAGGQLDKPLGDNCVETLRLLQAMGQRDPSLNQALQAAFDAREKAQWGDSDQKQFEAASALDTPEAYADYLKHCRLCVHREQALAAIKTLRSRAPEDAVVRAVPLAAQPQTTARNPVPTAVHNTAAQHTGVGVTGSTWHRWLGGILGLLVLTGVFWGSEWLGNGKKVEETPASVASKSATLAAPAVPEASAPKATVTQPLARSALRRIAGQVKKDCDSCPELVVIPGGEFMMGDEKHGASDERPAHPVKVADFLLGKTEVTVLQYLACVADKACPEPEWREADSRYFYQNGKEHYYRKLGDALVGDNYPIVGVSWNNAQSYVKWLNRRSNQAGYRLPSEAEWEYAARAGRSARWAHGDDEGQLEKYAWYERNSAEKMHIVGVKLPNKFGLYDMHGNVWEWVADCSHDNYVGAPADGSAWLQGCASESSRVLRGGSWSCIAAIARTAIRLRSTPTMRDIDIGFRVARSVP